MRKNTNMKNPKSQKGKATRHFTNPKSRKFRDTEERLSLSRNFGIWFLGFGIFFHLWQQQAWWHSTLQNVTHEEVFFTAQGVGLDLLQTVHIRTNNDIFLFFPEVR